ncbi:uncharacterized protein JCM6883_006856 [Sporobolomyces salmoneus]|uniref:uncharacterized protein n=1 Tax=Sporobolomyces salmoneus TaxID=183962 RepID=UPI0031787691
MASDPPVEDPTPPLDSPSPSSTPLPPPPPPPPLPPPPDLSSLLSRLPPPHVPIGGSPLHRTPLPPPRQTREQTDEKCWIFSNQSNARRALGLEPQISMYCYINFRNSLSSLTPVPGHPNAFLAKDAPQNSAPFSLSGEDDDEGGPGQLKKVTLKSTRVGDREVELPSYWWRWLGGRYWYVAKGKKAVERHFAEMGDLSKLENANEAGRDVNSWKMIRTIEKRCQEKKEEDQLPGKREERQIKKALGVVDLNENSESLTSLSTLYSTSLQRLHSHVLRIYSPLFTSLSLLPKTYTDGTQSELLSTVYTRLTDGSAFVLGERMVDALGKVSGELKERRARRDEERRNRGGGPDGAPPPVDLGFGGQQPRLPPPRSNNSIFGGGMPPSLPPSQPPTRSNDEEERPGDGQGREEEESKEGRQPRPPRPPQTPYSPGCTIM